MKKPKKKTQQMPNFAKTFVGVAELLDTAVIRIMISACHFLTALIRALFLLSLQLHSLLSWSQQTTSFSIFPGKLSKAIENFPDHSLKCFFSNFCRSSCPCGRRSVQDRIWFFPFAPCFTSLSTPAQLLLQRGRAGS